MAISPSLSNSSDNLYRSETIHVIKNYLIFKIRLPMQGLKNIIFGYFQRYAITISNNSKFLTIDQTFHNCFMIESLLDEAINYG
jgi:hypothetical protein